MKNKLYEFNPVLYPRKLWVLKDADDKYIKETFSYYDGTEISTEGCYQYDSYVIKARRKNDNMLGCLVVIQYRNISVETIAHEAVHVATDIFDDIRAIHDANNQEPFAYLVGLGGRLYSSSKNR